jgi:1-deoxy-D-xylulose-5-phosphate synthase
LPDHFVDHGDTALLLGELGLDASGIERSVNARLAAMVNS